MKDGEKSLALLREKLDHHRGELPLAVDPDHKFAIKKRIEEIEATIASWSNIGLPTNPGIHAHDEIATLTAELRRREAEDEDATEILEALLHARRHKREGLALRPSDVLMDRYRLDVVAGAGGFATVWQAWDRVENRKVAIKVLHHQHTADQSRVERFFSGARQLGRLSHPGLVRVLVEHAIDPAGHHFFVMAWHAGGDLAHAIKERTMTPHAALRALVRVAEALDYAHARGVIHRDVKPANILLDASGQATLADFDLVDALDTTHGTKTAAGLGTFKYAAPEQLEDAANVDARADVYGLGMTALYCLLGSDPPALVAATEPEILVGLDCAPALSEAIQWAVSYKVEKRPGGCADLAAALREPEVVQQVGRNARVWRGIGTAVLVIIGWLGLSQVPWGTDEPTEEVVPEPAPAPRGTKTEPPPSEPPPPAIDPTEFEDKLAEANSLYRKAKHDEAREILDEILDKAPKEPRALALLALILLEKGEFETALTTANDCVTVNDQEANCWIAIAIIEQENKNLPRALEGYRKYLEIDPSGFFANSAKKQVTRLESKVAG